jgi:hypothetical protein
MQKRFVDSIPKREFVLMLVVIAAVAIALSLMFSGPLVNTTGYAVQNSGGFDLNNGIACPTDAQEIVSYYCLDSLAVEDFSAACANAEGIASFDQEALPAGLSDICSQIQNQEFGAVCWNGLIDSQIDSWTFERSCP